MKPFLRDVAVNVLANLVAAAVIYLLGVAYGLFPRNDRAIALSVGVVLVVAGTSLSAWVLSALDYGKRWVGLFRIGTYLATIGVVVVFAAAFGWDFVHPHGLGHVWITLAIIFLATILATVMVIAGGFGILAIKDFRQRHVPQKIETPPPRYVRGGGRRRTRPGARPLR